MTATGNIQDQLWLCIYDPLESTIDKIEDPLIKDLLVSCLSGNDDQIMVLLSQVLKAQENNSETVDLILVAMACLACVTRNPRILQTYLFPKYQDLFVRGRMSISVENAALHSNDPEIWRVLLDHDFMSVKVTQTRFYIVAKKMIQQGRPFLCETLQLFIDYGFIITYDLVKVAATIGSPAVLRFLLSHVPGEKIRDLDLLQTTVGYRKLENVRILVEEAGLDINARLHTDDWGSPTRGGAPLLGWTALQVAARDDRVEILKYLLAKGANPAAKGWNQETALQAATRCHQHVAEKILQEVTPRGDIDDISTELQVGSEGERGRKERRE